MRPGIDHIGVTITFRCNDGKGNFLLHRRGPKCKDENGMWDFGGGKPKFGETLEDAVHREVKEEYGIGCRIQEKTPAYTLLRRQNRRLTHWIVIGYFVKGDIKKARIMEPGKASELGIFRLGRLPRPLHSAIPKELRIFRKEFGRYGRRT
jgi:8-oxo-dGTP pyrophosphatase MutT (NUDIX family)